jgi:hypothetical protein
MYNDNTEEVPRMVVMSKLADSEKEKYFEFLLENNIDFEKVNDGHYYVANVRIVVPEEGDTGPEDPSLQRSRSKQRQRTRALATGNSVKIFGRRASRPPQEMARVVSAIATARQLFDYSCYPKFSSLVTLRDTLRPRRRHYAWLMKMIEEIYDDRYDHDTADLRNAENGGDSKIPEEQTDRLSNIFPVFVVDFLSKRFGLRSLVDQHAWDLLYNVHALRATHLEVELFARFLEEYYDPDDLLFFLYVRSVVQKELVVNFVNRWTSASRGRERIPKPILLTYRECQIVARIVFGSEKDPLYVSFMAMVDRHVRGRKMRGNDSRRIEVYQFLHVALVGYHETRPAEDEEEIAAAEGIEAGMLSSGHDFSAGQVLVGSKDEQERLFIEAERDYESRMSKLAGAQLAADGKIEQDMDREMRVQEMEDAINRAMDARRAAQRSGEFKNESVAQLQSETQQMSNLVAAHANAQEQANVQRQALESSKRAALDAEINALSIAGNEQSGTKMDMNGLDQYLDTINKDRLAIEQMELALRRQPENKSSSNNSNNLSVAVSQLESDLSVPVSKTQHHYLSVLMESCDNLPVQVVTEIKAEIEALLTAKVSERLNKITNQYSSNTNIPPMPLSTDEPNDEQLLRGYSSLVVMTSESIGQGVTNERRSSMDQFAKCIVTNSDVREEIEPMVALLVTYAQARLTETEQ